MSLEGSCVTLFLSSLTPHEPALRRRRGGGSVLVEAVVQTAHRGVERVLGLGRAGGGVQEVENRFRSIAAQRDRLDRAADKHVLDRVGDDDCVREPAFEPMQTRRRQAEMLGQSGRRCGVKRVVNVVHLEDDFQWFHAVKPTPDGP